MNAIRQNLEQINLWLMLLLAFCLPLSTSAVTVAVLLVLACWLYEGQFPAKMREIVASPICIAVLLYFGALVLGLLWTDSLADGLEVIRKRWKILLLPVFLTTVRWDRRWWYVAAFLAGVIAAMLVIDLAYLDLFRHLGITSARFRFHTIVNHLAFTPMLALAVYLVLHQVLWGGMRGGQRWLLAALSAVMIVNVFLTRGRAGQLAFFVLMAVLCVQHFRKNLLRAILIPLVALPLVFVVAYQVSPVFQQRMDQIQQDIETFDQRPDVSSVGLRLHYWKIAWQIIKEEPWLGAGTGDFASRYAQINQQLSPRVPLTDNPHNQYIFVTAQLGILGLLTLLGLFFVHFHKTWQRQDEWKRIHCAFLVFFLTIMTTESYLNIYGTGFLFSLFSGVLFKRQDDWRCAVEGSCPPARTGNAAPVS